MRGQTVLEFALIAPLFFLLVCAVLDFGRLFYVQMTLQNAIRQAGRYASTGQHLANAAAPGGYDTRIQSITAIAQQQAPNLNVSGITITSNLGANNAGGPGGTVTIQLISTQGLITPLSPLLKLLPGFKGFNDSYTFTLNSTFQNELFPNCNPVTAGCTTGTT
ncbi:MAG: TadE/TadG family type IV pilus assembly protein [Terriglobales bacterium]